MSIERIFRKSSGHSDCSNHDEDRSFLKTALKWGGSVTPRVLPRVLFAALYSIFTVLIYLMFPFLTISITPFEYSGIVLGLLLVSRVNAGVERWWEARKIWGNIVNQSRNLAIIIHNYAPEKSFAAKEAISWVVVWPHSMREHLRNERSLENCSEFMNKESLKKIRSQEHMPMYIGSKIAGLLATMKKEGLEGFSFHQAEKERSLLIDAIGACERIKGTPIPLVLAIKIRRFILLFLSLLPFALVSELGWLTPLITSLTVYPLFCLDEIGVELQNPFSEKSLSHLPLGKICDTIQRNILSLKDSELGESQTLSFQDSKFDERNLHLNLGSTEN